MLWVAVAFAYILTQLFWLHSKSYDLSGDLVRVAHNVTPEWRGSKLQPLDGSPRLRLWYHLWLYKKKIGMDKTI